MSKYTAESIYGTFFTMLDNLSKENQDFLMKGVFSGDFLDDIKDNPKKAYAVLNDVVLKIEDGGKDKVSELLSDYKDKIYMMKNMLKDYGNFKEKKSMAKYNLKRNRKSLKEYRMVGFEQLVRDTIVEVLEDPHSDLFDYDDEIITYDNEGRARVTSNGDVDMDFITLPTYFFSSGRSPRNKKLAKLIDDIIETNFEYARERLWDRNKNELIELGILSKDDDKLNYNDLYDMGASGLAEELSEYEMDLEGTDLYTDIFCELEETDEGIELTVSMTVQDEYGSVLVRDYKPNTVLLSEDLNEKKLTDVIENTIRKVTEQF